MSIKEKLRKGEEEIADRLFIIEELEETYATRENKINEEKIKAAEEYNLYYQDREEREAKRSNIRQKIRKIRKEKDEIGEEDEDEA